jgi:hypothetical protein
MTAVVPCEHARNFRIAERQNILWADNKRRLSCKAILCVADLVRR